MAKNIFISEGRIVFFWGLSLNKSKEIQKTLDNYNSKGWKVVYFDRDTKGLSFFKLLILLFVNIFTLGFIDYWQGFSIIFEKDGEGSTTSIDNRTSTEILKELHNKLQKGEITQEEFDNKKKSLLNL